MISLIDFVKAFNTNLQYTILVVVDEKCDIFSGSKEKFITNAQNPFWFKFYVEQADFDVSYDYDYDNKLVEDGYCLYIDADNNADNFDDFTLDELIKFEKYINRYNSRKNKYKINNVISENNIVKSFNVEKCE